jgi:hypothetical protein
MNIYAQEILNRFGQTMLTNMIKEFPKGFHIVGGDDLEVIVGDRTKNVAFSRKTSKPNERFVFQGSPKFTRKGTN